MSPTIQIESKPSELIVRQRGMGRSKVLLILLGFLYTGKPLLRTLAAFLTSMDRRDWSRASFEAVLLIVVLVGMGAIVFGTFTSQMFRLDAHHLQLARKAMFQPWRRTSYPTAVIRALRFGVIRQSNSEVVRGLVFDINGTKQGFFEYLNPVDADDILKACEAFGVHTERDPAVHMMRDIQHRGWFVNPWRPDEVEDHPKEQQ